MHESMGGVAGRMSDDPKDERWRTWWRLCCGDATVTCLDVSSSAIDAKLRDMTLVHDPAESQSGLEDGETRIQKPACTRRSAFVVNTLTGPGRNT